MMEYSRGTSYSSVCTSNSSSHVSLSKMSGTQGLPFFVSLKCLRFITKSIFCMQASLQKQRAYVNSWVENAKIAKKFCSLCKLKADEGSRNDRSQLRIFFFFSKFSILNSYRILSLLIRIFHFTSGFSNMKMLYLTIPRAPETYRMDNNNILFATSKM